LKYLFNHSNFYSCYYWYFFNTCREEDGVIPSETVSIEKILVVDPQNTWKIKYHSREYWATNLKKTLVFPFILNMRAFFNCSSIKISPPGGCNYVYSSLCSVIFLYVIFHVQISLTGIELNYGTVMEHLSVEIVKMRSVRVTYHLFFNFIYTITINSPSYFDGNLSYCWFIQSMPLHNKITNF